MPDDTDWKEEIWANFTRESYFYCCPLNVHNPLTCLMFLDYMCRFSLFVDWQ